MAVCDCGAAASRVKKLRPDAAWICVACSPDDFPAERFTAPSDKKLYQAYDVAPSRYKKVDGGYVATEEERQDLQDWACREDKEEEAKKQRALEARRVFCATKRKNESDEERRINDEKVREEVRKWEAEARLQAMGIVLPQ